METLVLRNQTGNDVTTSLIVAEVFGKEHRNVLRDIENLSCSDSFRMLNFERTPYTHPQNGQTYEMYEMTKDGFSFLVMGYTGEKAGQFKELFISEFNKREALLKSDEYILMRSQEIMQRKIKELEMTLQSKQQVIGIQEDLIKEQAPKALFADAVATSTSSCLVGELSKILRQNGIGIGQNRLFEYLRNNGYLCQFGERYNQPTQRSMEMELFEVKKTSINKPDGTIMVTTTTKVTGKGQIYFVNKFLKPDTYGSYNRNPNASGTLTANKEAVIRD